MRRVIIIGVSLLLFFLPACGNEAIPAPTLTATAEKATPTPMSTPTPTLASTPKPLTALATLEGTTGPIYSISWSPDGEKIVSGGYKEVNFWDAEQGTKLATRTGHANFVWGVAFSPDGRLVASASGVDNSVRIWNVEDYTEKIALDNQWAFCISWSSDGTRLAVGNAGVGVSIWNVETGTLLQRLIDADKNWILSVDWSPDDSMIAVGMLENKILIWDVKAEKVIKVIEKYTEVRSDANGVAWSLDGTILASTHQDSAIRLWDTDTWELLRTMKGALGGSMRPVVWSPDGRLLATSGQDHVVRVWNPATGQQLANLQVGKQDIWGLSWAPDGSRLVAGSGFADRADKPGFIFIVGIP